jgi:putative transposase
MNRGLRQGPVFIDDWCCQEFLALLPEAVERFEIIVHGYALMPNHFHLLLESSHGNLSRAMAYVSATFSRPSIPDSTGTDRSLEDAFIIGL